MQLKTTKTETTFQDRITSLRYARAAKVLRQSCLFVLCLLHSPVATRRQTATHHVPAESNGDRVGFTDGGNFSQQATVTLSLLRVITIGDSKWLRNSTRSPQSKLAIIIKQLRQLQLYQWWWWRRCTVYTWTRLLIDETTDRIVEWRQYPARSSTRRARCPSADRKETHKTPIVRISSPRQRRNREAVEHVFLAAMHRTYKENGKGTDTCHGAAYKSSDSWPPALYDLGSGRPIGESAAHSRPRLYVQLDQQ